MTIQDKIQALEAKKHFHSMMMDAFCYTDDSAYEYHFKMFKHIHYEIRDLKEV